MIAASLPPDLDALRGAHRVVVLFGDPKSAAVVRQRRILTDPGVRERDIVVLAGTADHKRRFRLKTDGFAFVLIGKDGGVKLVRKTPITRRELYGVIDAMPMRRDEMRRRQ